MCAFCRQIEIVFGVNSLCPINYKIIFSLSCITVVGTRLAFHVASFALFKLYKTGFETRLTWLIFSSHFKKNKVEQGIVSCCSSVIRVVMIVSDEKIFICKMKKAAK